MKILHFADLHLGVETYGKINPETGVSTRLDDFLAALDKLVDYALKEHIDLVIFCGDAYKSREPSQTQQREFAKRINRLASGGSSAEAPAQEGIPIFLLIGNHDMPNAIGKATSTEIFHTLSVKNVYVSNKPEVLRIETKSGVVQVASLPWLRKNALLKRDEAKNLTIEETNQQLQGVLTAAIASLVEQLDPALPAVLAAHISVGNAMVGSERMMAIGQDAFVMPGNIANPAFDYIALGHIHKRQVLWENPPMVYAGSLERVDFGEEADDKGFYVIDIETDSAGKRHTTFTFHPITGRVFRTVSVNLEADDPDPTATVLRAIHTGGQHEVKDAIVRVQISAPEEAAGQLRDTEIREALKGAYYTAIAKDIRQEARPRLGQTANIEGISPLEALKTYLETNHTPERAKILLEYGEKMIEGHNGEN